MNINPKRVKIGMKNPRVLKNFLIFFFENFSDLINLSLSTAESIMKRKHVRNGIEDNSPFLKKFQIEFCLKLKYRIIKILFLC